MSKKLREAIVFLQADMLIKKLKKLRVKNRRNTNFKVQCHLKNASIDEIRKILLHFIIVLIAELYPIMTNEI